MKSSRLERFYGHILLVIFGGIVLHAPLSVMLSSVFPDQALLVKSWKEILLIILVPIVLVIVRKRRLFRLLSTDWVVRIIAAYAFLHILFVFVLSGNVFSIMAGLAIDLRYLLLFLYVYIYVKLYPDSRKLFLIIGIIGACIVVTFATIQIFLPYNFLEIIGYSKHTIIPYLLVDQNYDFIRVNSTLRGPNPLGAYSVMVLALLVASVGYFGRSIDKKHLVIPVSLLGLFSVTALWVSYSRSALVAAAVAVAIVILSFQSRRVAIITLIIGSVVMTSIFGAILFSKTDNEFISNVLLHKNPNSSATTGSNEGHLDSIEVGTERLLKQPLGGGVGSTGSASLLSNDQIIIENQYLFIAHESGWIGLGLFLSLFGIILSNLWKRKADWLARGLFASGIGLSLIGLLLPVWVDDTVSIVWWGFAAVAIGGPILQKKTEHTLKYKNGHTKAK